MQKSAADFLSEACRLAEKGRGHTRPNPPVGAVVVFGGKVVGRGYHRRCGGDHAEVAAIKDALRKLRVESFAKVRKPVELYVTLEPCSRPGRVGACTDAIVAAGIGSVVYGCPDPNPKNRNRARRVLSRHGIACRLERHAWCEHLVRQFSKFIRTGMPYVTVKLAMSLDGRICDRDGNSRYVSSESARKMTGSWRERVDVMMVGAETIRRDNPSLLCHTKRNDDLWRVVISASGRIPKNAQVFTDEAKERTLVYGDVAEAMRDLGRRGFMHVLCEGGLGLAVSLAERGFVDEWITVLAPKVIGDLPIVDAVRIGRVLCLPG